MSAPVNQPISREDKDRFKAYKKLNPAWGSLHIVLDDLNVKDGHVNFCLQQAQDQGDTEGAYLAGVLLGMSKSQRIKLAQTIA